MAAPDAPRSADGGGAVAHGAVRGRAARWRRRCDAGPRPPAGARRCGTRGAGPRPPGRGRWPAAHRRASSRSTHKRQGRACAGSRRWPGSGPRAGPSGCGSRRSCRRRRASAPPPASSSSRKMRNSWNGLIEPTVRSSSPYFESLKWKPPRRPTIASRLTTCSMLVLGRWWPRSTRHWQRSPAPCASSSDEPQSLLTDE